MQNMTEAIRYLSSFSTGPDDILTFQTFDDKKKEKEEAKQSVNESLIRHGFLRDGKLVSTNDFGSEYDLLKFLRKLNDRGDGIFLCINRTDGQGRKDENVVSLRALFIDVDGKPVPESWHVLPSMLVRRDATHAHAYWFLKPGEKLEDFTPAQTELIRTYGSDDKPKDKTRVLRIPGFHHNKHEPIEIGIEFLEPSRVYAIKDVVTLKPEFVPVFAPAKDEGKTGFVFDMAGCPSTPDSPYGPSFTPDIVDSWPIEDRLKRYEAYVMSPNTPQAIAGGGQGECTLIAVIKAAHKFGLTVQQARSIIERYNETKAQPQFSQKELEHKLTENYRYVGKDGKAIPFGSLLGPPTNAKLIFNSDKPDDKPETQPELLPSDQMPESPMRQELLDRISGTVIGSFVDSILKTEPRISVPFAIASAYALMGTRLANRIMIEDSYTNAMILLVGEQATGKSTCMNLAGECLPKGTGQGVIGECSDKILLRNLGKDPWGLGIIHDAGEHMGGPGWKSAALRKWFSAFDNRHLDQGAVSTGIASVSNVGPSLIMGIQPDLLLKVSTGDLVHSGFFSRLLIAKVPPKYADNKGGASNENFSKKSRGDWISVVKEFEEWEAQWVPDQVCPGKELTKPGKGSQGDIPLGIWVHPLPDASLSVEWPTDADGKQITYWQQKKTHPSVTSMCDRLIKHYLPLFAIPFCTIQELRDRRIPGRAILEAQDLMLPYHWALVESLRMIVKIPDRGEPIVKRIVAVVDSAGRMKKRAVGQKAHVSGKDFEVALTACIDRGLLKAEEETNKNGTATIWLTSVLKKGEHPKPHKHIPEPKSEPLKKKPEFRLSEPEPDGFSMGEALPDDPVEDDDPVIPF